MMGFFCFFLMQTLQDGGVYFALELFIHNIYNIFKELDSLFLFVHRRVDNINY
jgi:hypothetical protein